MENVGVAILQVTSDQKVSPASHDNLEISEVC